MSRNPLQDPPQSPRARARATRGHVRAVAGHTGQHRKTVFIRTIYRYVQLGLIYDYAYTKIDSFPPRLCMHETYQAVGCKALKLCIHVNVGYKFVGTLNDIATTIPQSETGAAGYIGICCRVVKWTTLRSRSIHGATAMPFLGVVLVTTIGAVGWFLGPCNILEYSVVDSVRPLRSAGCHLIIRHKKSQTGRFLNPI